MSHKNSKLIIDLNIKGKPLIFIEESIGGHLGDLGYVNEFLFYFIFL